MCGIIGVYGAPDAATEAFRGLLTLQHRGQDSAGILSYHFKQERFRLIKNRGLVGQVFSKEALSELTGSVSIGHTRYLTIGKGEISDIQPFVANFPIGIGMAHNGNLVNHYQLEEDLKKNNHCHPLTNNDLETIQNIFAQSLAVYLKKQNDSSKVVTADMIQDAVKSVFEAAKGGYCVVGVLAGHGMFAFRDPMGIRPLVFGKRNLSADEIKSFKEKNLDSSYQFGKSYCFSSESVSLDFLEYEFVRDVLPGEFVFIDQKGNIHSKILTDFKPHPCMFEWVYFSSPESIQSTQAVYKVRMNLGKELAKVVTKAIADGEIDPDIVVAVPETSRISALSLAEAANIPYREGLIKNRYIQRSFILKGQGQRKNAVDLKLSPVLSEIQGKNVLLVDDSIVRGTTSKRIINLVRKAGAKKVYFASTCPPIKFPCFYGVDFPSKQELVAGMCSPEEVAAQIEADKVIYLDMSGLKRAISLEGICTACLDGDYPVDISQAQNFAQKRHQHRGEENP